MLRSLTLFLSIVCLSPVLAQTGLITGKVLDSSTGDPIPFANVFLSNATKGTRSNEKGEFILSTIKAGQYDLIVSFVGYKKISRHTIVNDDKHEYLIRLEKNSIELQNVVIKADPDWERNFNAFKRIFIGRTENAASCKVLNPKVVNVSYDKETSTLEASTEDFLIIENAGLGYRLKYLLNTFSWERKTGLVYYAGEVLFEDMNGGKAQTRRWMANRKKAYMGSCMHFFRSLIQNRVLEEGFIAKRLIKRPVPGRPSDSLTDAKILRFKTAAPFSDDADSLAKWLGIKNSPRNIQILTRDTLTAEVLAKRSNIQNQYALGFRDYLYVEYKNKDAQQNSQYIYNPTVRSDRPSSLLTLNSEYAFFDSNGIVINPKILIYEGYWNQGIAELLPHDFTLESTVY